MSTPLDGLKVGGLCRVPADPLAARMLSDPTTVDATLVTDKRMLTADLPGREAGR